MRAVVTRVRQASVMVDNENIAKIGHGLLILLAVAHDDSAQDVRWMSDKLANLRIFCDAAGKMGLDVRAALGELLVVSQFTLYADAKRGRRPSFVGAASAHKAEPLVDAVVDALNQQGLRVSQGRFGADMIVSSDNDGPVTLIIDTPRQVNIDQADVDDD